MKYWLKINYMWFEFSGFTSQNKGKCRRWMAKQKRKEGKKLISGILVGL
jgi:hypothetical protein